MSADLFIGASPYKSINVADLGDVSMNMFDIHQACKDIMKGFAGIIQNGCRPIAVGGDHTITYPILQAFKVGYDGMYQINESSSLTYTFLLDKQIKTLVALSCIANKPQPNIKVTGSDLGTAVILKQWLCLSICLYHNIRICVPHGQVL